MCIYRYSPLRPGGKEELMNSTLESEVNQLHAELCGALAGPSRILILYELSQSPRNVTELCHNLKMPQPLVSRHLKILRERGMVTTERRGTTITYRLIDTRVIQALDLLRATMRDNIARRAALVDALAA
jgi:ArsR family transcriptional regulator